MDRQLADLWGHRARLIVGQGRLKLFSAWPSSSTNQLVLNLKEAPPSGLGTSRAWLAC